ncbi:RNA ligase [Nitrosococcus oceani]|uniref:ATP-dependent DNA ligase n=1 Tax=Nitrosococcus oceani (strain ATCC 19707 / BCRC 17464 / JCM 30415 / NCIMB 11848 / C-107) TaxID=323261 RepID=Q3JB94_NITOC|nr:RNA ligase [Nitrosococcus oceani]ABA57902.1 ATP-dependent DNA ligase [Nitrosococcus oceani ATCC 19707]GEM19545.1 RNA ligase [Nitrosococcus oceani]
MQKLAGVLQNFFNQAHAKGRLRRECFGNLIYYRLIDDSQPFRRGTVIFEEGTLIPGYPQIGRMIRLDKGLKEQFTKPFWAEEKVDGYNVRIFLLGERLLGVTRGGFLCPFTVDRLPDLIDERIFSDHPDFILCGEIAGPENPYLIGSPPFIKEDIQLFIFDCQRKGEFDYLSQAEKHQLMEHYSLPSVRNFGLFKAEDILAIKQLMMTLDTEGCEGLVFKEDVPRGKRSKYVTSDASLSDIQAMARYLPDFPPEYFIGRILRSVIFLDEEGISSTHELKAQLGSAFIDGLLKAIKQCQREHRVYHRFRCRLHDRANARQLLAHLARGDGHIQIVKHRLVREGEFYIFEFDKVFQRTTGLLGELLSGEMVYD